MSRFDVIVVGGGPAGSATAIHLARRGLHPLVLDARVFPRSKPCGDAVSPGATPLLHDLGVWRAIRARTPARIDRWTIRSPGGRWFGGGYGDGLDASPAEGVAVDRRDLDETLLGAARAAGADVREGRRVFELLRNGGRVVGVRARGPDGEPETLRAEFVVGADGLRSRVARLLGPVRGGPRPRLALVARLHGVTGLGTRGELRLTRDGVVGSVPIGRHRANVTLVVPRSEGRRLASDPEGFFRDRVREVGLGPRTDGARLTRRLDVTGPFEARPARQTSPGVLLVGDAAGYFDPLTGQGVYGALAGAALAARAVAASLEAPDGEPDRLAEYERALDRLLEPVRRVQRLIDGAVRRTVLIEPLAVLLGARPGLARLLLEVTGDRLPAGALLRPAEWARALGPGQTDVAPALPRIRSWSRHAHT